MIIITIVAILIAIYCAASKKKKDIATEEENKILLEENETLIAERDNLLKGVKDLQDTHKNLSSENIVLTNSISKEKEHLSTLQDNIKTTLKNQEDLSQQAFKNYCDILENDYKEKEKEYEQLCESMKNAYANKQIELIAEADKIRADLDKIHATRAAAIEAMRREKEIEEDLSFYCLEISDLDKSDIARLDALKSSLNKPRVLSMLIWQTWFQKPLKSLSANVIGTDDKTGIYKITNIKTKECYIGQAVSIKDRWTEHAKCGLGIDTPAGNKLYKAIQDFGLWNFSFEVLEECPREQLNEKEKYYIDLYSAYDFGYNSTKGNK